MKISQAVTLRIKELLEVHKLTLYKIEKKTGISHDTLKSIIKGKTKGVNLKTLVIIADGFDLSISDFLNSELFSYDNLEID